MKQPLIGLVMTKHASSINKAGTNAAYVEYFRQFGNVIMIDPAIQDVLPLDLLVLPGGADIDSMRYDQVPSFKTGRGDTMYEYFDTNILSKYIEANIPVFGICRGSQTLYAYFGGKDYAQHQDIKISNPRSERVDTLKFTQDSLSIVPVKELFLITGKYKVNSIHHQAYYRMPDNLVELARSAEYGNVEVFKHKELQIIGYQGHPEETNCQYASKLIKYLLNG